MVFLFPLYVPLWDTRSMLLLVALLLAGKLSIPGVTLRVASTDGQCSNLVHKFPLIMPPLCEKVAQFNSKVILS